MSKTEEGKAAGAQKQGELLGLLLLDDQARITSCAGDVEVFLSRSRSDLLGMTLTELFPGFDASRSDQICQAGDQRVLLQRAHVFGGPDQAAPVESILLRPPECFNYQDAPQELISQYLMEDLQEIIEGSFDGILVTDADGTVQLVNQAYIHNTGISREQLIGRNMQELVNPVWMKQSVVFLVREQMGPVSLQHDTQNGKHIIVTGMPVFDQEGRIKRIVVNSRDISEIYSLNQQLQVAKSMEEYYAQSLQLYEHNQGDNHHLIICSNKMQNIFHLAKKVSGFDTSVLITGESGVGKEELARYIHRNSLRREKSFIAVNCGAIPENLLESELFGYEGGAFTGALRGGKAGLFEAADGGTLMLDEIGEMPLPLQVKLLRVLERQEVTRIGGTRSIPINVRLISATNANLPAMVEKGTFRGDLYYRLNVLLLPIPPLRERTEDIPPLSLKFIHMFNDKYGMRKRLTSGVLQEFLRYSWPGNVRELKNTIENMFVLADRDCLQVNDIPWYRAPQPPGGSGADDPEAEAHQTWETLIAQYEKQLLLAAAEKFRSTRQIAAEFGINQSTVVRKLKKYGISL